jgi:diguanylate cyclase (GGDEF)-like protein
MVRMTQSQTSAAVVDNGLRRAVIHLRFSKVLVLLGLCGLLATCFVSLQLWRGEQSRLRSTFNDRLNNIALDLDSGLKSELQVVDDLATTQASLDHFDRAQFHIYAQSVFADHPEMLALGWASVVAAVDRNRFEQQVRQEGLLAFQIVDIDEHRNRVPLGDWPVLYPVAATEVQYGNLDALGVNLASDPPIFGGLAPAKSSGKVIASPPFPLLIPGNSHPTGVIFTKFVTTRNTPAWQTTDGPGTGYISAIFEIQPALEAIIAERNTDGLELQVTDAGEAGTAAIPLFQTAGHNLTAIPDWSTDLPFAGRIWRLSAAATDSTLLEPHNWEPYSALAVGVIITLLLVLHSLSVMTDLTTRKQMETALLEAHDAAVATSLRDPLTGLPNRALFIDRLDRALARTNRSANSLAVLFVFVDLDDFKAVNDSLGHEQGDALLVVIAERLKTALRTSTDTPARLGGDEFTVLLEDLTDPDEATHVAERIARAVRAPVMLQGGEVVISASIGIAALGTERANSKDLLHWADVAMYRAKENGKGRCEIFQAVHLAA